MLVVFEYLIAVGAVIALTCLFKSQGSTILNGARLTLLGGGVVTLGSIGYSVGIARGPVAQTALSLILFVFVLVQLVRDARKRSNLSWGGMKPWQWLAPVLSILLFLINAVRNTDLAVQITLGRLLAVIFIVSFVLWVAVCRVTVSQLAFVVASSVLVLVALSPLSSDNWRACDQFKCGPFGAIYTGPLGSENTLAIFCGAGILSLLVLKSGKATFSGLFVLAAALYATESRTSQLAIVIGVVAWLSVPLVSFSQGGKHKITRRHLWGSLILVIHVIGVYIIYNSHASDFSNRGNIWHRGITALGDQWPIGLGIDRWVYLQEYGFIPGLFPHSQYLTMLFSGGVLGICLMFLLAVTPLFVARTQVAFRYAIAYSVYLSVLGLTETYWNPVAVDGFSILVLPIIAIFFDAFHSSAYRSGEPSREY